MRKIIPVVVIVLLVAVNVAQGFAFLEMSAMLSKSHQRQTEIIAIAREAQENTKKALASGKSMGESFDTMKNNFWSMKKNFDECYAMLRPTP